ncbi:MAG: hypothetical protein WC654_00415 [Patescibacteria group bacterium]
MSETRYRISQQMESRSDKEERDFWSYFDAYKMSGKGATVVRSELRSFQHVTNESRVRDEALLAKKKGRPKMREQKPSGTDAFAFENFLTAQAKRSNWFGGELSPTTEYDDWISGVDAVVEWRAEDGGLPIRMAIDFTSTTQFETLYKKSDKLEGNVTVKYFRSAIENEDGEPKEFRASMPIVLLGLDEEGFREIVRRAVPLDHHHPLRRLLLEQTAAQVDFQLTELTRFISGTQMARNGRPIDEVLDRGVHPKIKQRFHDLSRLKERVDEELVRASLIPIDERWTKIAATSKTHLTLSGR